MNNKSLIAILIILTLVGYLVWQNKGKPTLIIPEVDPTIDSFQNRHRDTIPEKKITTPEINTNPLSQQNSKVHNPKNDSILSNWKTYTNSKLGLIFQYPDTWIKKGEESNSINRNGQVMSIELNFIDTVSQSIFLLAYHLPPYGAEIYKWAEDEYISSKNSSERVRKKITVAGSDAIETFTTMKKDIHGNIYDPALKSIHIVMLDKQKTGAFNLNFRTSAPDSEAEMVIAKFNKALSTFEFK